MRRRWIAGTAALAMVMLGPSATASAAAPTETGALAAAGPLDPSPSNPNCPRDYPNGPWTFGNLNVTLRTGNWRVIDAPSNAEGTPVYINNHHGGPNQEWCTRRIEVAHGDAYMFASVSAWKQARALRCLMPEGTHGGAAVRLAACSKGDWQIWWLERVRDGAFRLKNFEAGKCLDVRRAATNAGATIHVFPCHFQPNQLWF